MICLSIFCFIDDTAMERVENVLFHLCCSTMRGRIKGTDSTINAILATAVLYELRWKIWNGAE